MRGADLNVFDFDYDLAWAGLFLNADGKVYGRYGSRDAGSADGQLSLAGLKYALREALAAHRREAARAPALARPRRTVEQYPAAKRLKESACIHCHQVYDFRREAAQAAGTWDRSEVWVYPQPENLGVTLDTEQGNRVQAVAADSPASRLGLRAGDLLRRVNDLPVASIADVRYALHGSPARGPILFAWQRHGQSLSGSLTLADGWRQTDLSWRASLRRLGPPPSVHGEDLTPTEKKALGLPEKSLAFRQGNFVTVAARQAGIRQNDVILGVDGKALEMTVGQFLVYIQLNYQAGDIVTYDVLRNGQRLDVPLKLPSRLPF
jgi:S1-C subfamily serine protease